MLRRTPLATLLTATLLAATPVLAQNQPGKSKAPPPSRISKPAQPKPGEPAPAKPAAPTTTQPKAPIEAVTLTPGSVEMSDELFRLETAGLSMNLPIGAGAQVTSAAATASATITPAGAAEGQSAWLINIQTPRSRDKSHTADHVARKVLDQLQASVGVVDRNQRDREGNIIERVVSTRATVVEPVKSVIVRAERPEFERPAARFYIKLPDKDAVIIRGYTVFQTAPGEFITFDLITPEANFEKARPVYEATIATARFRDATALATQRGAAINAGVNFLAKLANPDYDAAIAVLNNQWYRLYKPAPTGSDKDFEEVAYRRIQAKRGSRGEIDTSSRPEKWGAVEREAGIVVRIEARYLQDTSVVDVVGVYWMSADGRSEAWSLQQASRDPQKRTPAIFTETGAREGDQMSIAISGSGQDNRRIKPEVPKMGYITQVQSFLLPVLLVQKQAVGEFGFYSYQSRNEKIPIAMRRDSLAQSSEGSTNWVLTSQQSEDRPPQVSSYTEKGDLIQTIFSAEKLVWAPTTLDRLAELWKAKGLPMN